jgi:C-terminal processing protease CtpA/Prc
VALTPVHGHPAEDLPPPLGSLPSSRGRERAWWSEVLPAERALYVQFNEVRASDAAGQSLAEFAATLAPTVEREALERVIVDVRWNGGGDNTTFGPLIDALRDPRLDRPGRLFGLIGRHTYSAAGNFVTVLERDTGAVLVGEPTGGAPNQYGDASAVHLPNHPELLVRVSTRYHAFSKADDPRVTHEPDVLVPLRSEDYFAGRDPVLARACTYAPK